MKHHLHAVSLSSCNLTQSLQVSIRDIGICFPEIVLYIGITKIDNFILADCNLGIGRYEFLDFLFLAREDIASIVPKYLFKETLYAFLLFCRYVVKTVKHEIKGLGCALDFSIDRWP